MPDYIDIYPEPVTTENGLAVSRARLAYSKGHDETLWFRTPEEHARHLANDAIPFIIATLQHAMAYHLDLRVHAPVSRTLLRNLDEFQTAWNRWLPNQYWRIEITPDSVMEDMPARGPDRVISAFSGGLDSAFTLWRHARDTGWIGRRPITSALMVHGLDIPWDEASGAFERAAARSHAMTDSLGIPLLTCQTNLRMFVEPWMYAHGTGVAACLHAMSAQHNVAMIPGTHTYEALRLPCGSNPVTDPLMSSERLTIIYEGTGLNRPQKAGAIADWPEAMQNLRVCWSGDELDRNCGACGKCVGAAIAFTANKRPIPECLPILDLLAAINAIKHKPIDQYAAQRLEERILHARQMGVTAPWLAAAEDWLRIARMPPKEPLPIRLCARILTEYRKRR